MGQETWDRVLVKPIKSYRDLEIWQESIQIVKVVYTLTNRFPSNEQFGLISQMRRAAVSIPANVAEGYARHHRTELRQFLYIALGSLAELETLVIVAGELGYAKAEELLPTLDERLTRLRYKILAFLRSLR